MKETKIEPQKDGTTKTAQAGMKSSQAMKHGEEPRDMLLALLNSPLETMMKSQQAKVLGKAMTNHGMSTIIIFYNTQPTENGTLEIVGNA